MRNAGQPSTMVSGGEVKRETTTIQVLAVGAETADFVRSLENIAPGRFQVQTAVSMVDALARAGSEPPHVLILESTGNEAERYEVWRRLSTHFANGELPIVFVTPQNGDFEEPATDRATYKALNLASEVEAAVAMARRQFEAEVKATSKPVPPQTMREMVGREKLLAEVVDNLRGIVAIRDVGAESPVYINQAWAEITGVSVEAYRENPSIFLDLVHPEDRDLVERSYRRFLVNGGGDAEWRFVRPSGEIRWVWARNFGVYDDAGRTTHVITVVDDITLRKRAELALSDNQQQLEKEVRKRTSELEESNRSLRNALEEQRRTAERLRETEERYRTVADFTYDWESWVAPNGNMLYVSPSSVRVTGYDPAAFNNELGFERTMIVPEDLPAWKEHLRKAHSGGGSGDVPAFEFRIRHKDGSIRWIEHRCQHVIDKEGRFIGIRRSDRDITRRKEIEAESANSREMLAHLSRVATLGELTASIAHELNQPLAAILANAQAVRRLLDRDNPDLDEVVEAIDDIINDERRANEVIRRFRGLLRRKSNPLIPLDLSAVVGEAVDIAASATLAAGVKTKLELAKGLLPVLIDRSQIQQVMINLVINSCDAMAPRPGGGRELRISTVMADMNDAVKVTVQDNGPGLEPELAPTIFEPFVTNKKDGLGIGLVICQTIIEAHGGRIWVEDPTAGGARFCFSIPIADDDNP